MRGGGERGGDLPRRRRVDLGWPSTKSDGLRRPDVGLHHICLHFKPRPTSITRYCSHKNHRKYKSARRGRRATGWTQWISPSQSIYQVTGTGRQESRTTHLVWWASACADEMKRVLLVAAAFLQATTTPFQLLSNNNKGFV